MLPKMYPWFVETKRSVPSGIFIVNLTVVLVFEVEPFDPITSTFV